jgi:hypothetical protein
VAQAKRKVSTRALGKPELLRAARRLKGLLEGYIRCHDDLADMFAGECKPFAAHVEPLLRYYLRDYKPHRANRKARVETDLASLALTIMRARPVTSANLDKAIRAATLVRQRHDPLDAWPTDRSEVRRELEVLFAPRAGQGRRPHEETVANRVLEVIGAGFFRSDQRRGVREGRKNLFDVSDLSRKLIVTKKKR